MDRKELEARLTAMKAAHDQHLANANAAAGAMQELQYWLGRLPPELVEVSEPKAVEG